MVDRRGVSVTIVAIAVAGVLVASGCARFRSGDRAKAAVRLHEVDALLTQLDMAYAAGRGTEAQQLAHKIDYAFNDSIAETVVTQMDKPLHRKLEPILEHDLEEKVTAGAPVAEVSAMIAQGHQLIAQAIREIGR